MVLTLFLVALGASAALGFVHEFTKDAITKAEAAKLDLAIKRVVPEFDNEPGKNSFERPAAGGEKLTFYVATKAEDTVGYAIESFSKNAFGGLLRVLVGLDTDGKIVDVAVLEHKETPGLGTKMVEEPFKSQFRGIPSTIEKLDVTKNGGTIDAITASTITSVAYCEAVKTAFDAYNALDSKEGGKK